MAANLTASTAWPQAAYTVTDLGTLGGSSSFALGVNASGQVVGYSELADGTSHAFLYSDSTMIDLGALGGNASIARGINASGLVVGSASPGDFTEHAFLYSDPAMADLGRSSVARGINASGQVVGSFETAGAERAFLYSGSTLADLGTFGGRDSEAFGINTRGQVVGNARYADGTQRAFLYSGSIMTDLGTLGGGGSTATAINDNGQVVGGADLDDRGTSHAFRCNVYSGSIMTDLGILGGTYNYSYASAINASGQVVGTSTFDDTGASHAFIYSSTMTDLNGLISPLSGWTLCEATGINDAGQIVGYGIINGQAHAFLLTPVVTVAVTFDAEGGTVSPASKDVTLDAAYGSLPTPSRAGGMFTGWWTGANGAGTQVTAATVVSATADHTLYAKYVTLPTVTTTAPAAIGTTTATSGGKVTNDGGVTVTARGACWSIAANPTVANAKTIDGTGTSAFTSTLTGLSANTTYYVRAYATNSAGTGYGAPQSFTTPMGKGADFVVTSIVLTPALPAVGGKFTATITVKNQGILSGKAGNLYAWLNKPAVAAVGEKGDKSASVSTLKPGVSKTVKMSLTAPKTWGTFTLRAFIDAKNGVKEDDEYNNQETYVYATGLPDFEILDVSLSPETPATGQTFTAYVTVTNSGKVAGDAGYLDLWADSSALPATPVPGSKTKGNKYKTVGKLQPGQEKIITVTGLKTPVGTAWTLGMLIDSRAKTLELDETNNWLEFDYGVSGTPPPPPPG